MSETNTLAEAYVAEQERCRELIVIYEDLPNRAGFFAAKMVREILRRADRAVMEGDTVAMLGIYEEMKGCN